MIHEFRHLLRPYPLYFIFYLFFRHLYNISSSVVCSFLHFVCSVLGSKISFFILLFTAFLNKTHTRISFQPFFVYLPI
ncbi:unnamed protein product [Meloidogyne enterolobii]|uniref:Uncharacterized protein n=1 Tax=Meloidogyne enterolobii TaxID=390850 RepID=A0ACB1B4Y7_MELEN